jgi:hypothetical protein
MIAGKAIITGIIIKLDQNKRIKDNDKEEVH